MILKNSGINIQCVDQGWQIYEVPTDPALKSSFGQVLAKYGIGQDHLLKVPQKHGIDTSDRVELGSQLLKDFVNAGL